VRAVRLALAALVALGTTRAAAQTPVTTSEFVYESAPFPSAHASTLVETRDGILAAWFGGTRESAPDVGIWTARRVNGAWTPPVEVANGVQPDGTRHPCWNPVLFRMADGSIALFYKVGPSPTRWWGVRRTSRDDGLTWGPAERLPDGVLGPIKNKPLRLADGTLLSPSSTETPDSANVWRVHFERSTDAGRTWTVIPVPEPREARAPGAIQPSILTHAGGRLQAIGRSRAGRLFETWSDDGGRTWTPLALTTLPNPNAGTDAVTLRDGRHLVVYNHTPRGRSPLNVAVSRDGRAWDAVLVLERDPGEYSYPSVIQTSDGMVHVTYTWRRERVKHVSFDPARLRGAPIRDGVWPAEIR